MGSDVRPTSRGGRLGGDSSVEAAPALAVAVWAEPALNPWITLVDAAIQHAGLQVPDDRRGPGRMFSLGAPGKLESLLRASGFEDVTVDGVDLTWEYRSFEAYWEEEVLIRGPFEAFFDSLQQVQLGAVRDRLRSLLGPYALETGGYRVPGVTLVASGRRPTAGAPGRARGEMATLPRALSD